jgi:hypothetical protein
VADVDKVSGFLSQPKSWIKNREGDSMTRGFGITSWVAVVAMLSILTAPPRTIADDSKANAKPGIDAKTAFARIKTLAGTWKSEITGLHKGAGGKESSEEPKQGEKHEGDAPVIYKVTGAGSALMETQFPGSDHEMVSVYHLDGDELRMTHYCAAGNQPRVKLDKANSTPDQLIFLFDGGTNLNAQKDMHIHGLKITFHEDGKVTSAWEGYVGGKSAGTTTFALSRQKTRSTNSSKSTSH